MGTKRLTDITAATGVTLSDLIHIVITGDTSQNTAGSSYKVTLQQVYNAFNVPTSFTFTGNTSATCITDLYVSNIYGCSPITIHDSLQTTGSNVTGTLALSLGDDTRAIGDYSFARGLRTSAFTDHSHAEGRATKTTALYAHAEGLNTTAAGSYSHAEGSNTQANGSANHAEGIATVAGPNRAAHAEGEYTTAYGGASHAEGFYSYADGEWSHAEGYQTQTIGTASHSNGIGTIAVGDYQFVTGQYNLTASTQGAFIIGNGLSGNSRSTLLVAAGNEVNISGKTITTTIQITSGATAGYVLTAIDSNGNAAWQAPTGGNTCGSGTTNYTTNENFTAGETKTITHSLNTKFVHCSVWDTATDELVAVQIVRTSGNITNEVDVTIATAGNYDILVTGIGCVTQYTTTETFTTSETKTITHNLNTKFVHCSVWDSGTDEIITPQIVRTSGNITNAVDVTIATAGTYDILITK